MIPHRVAVSAAMSAAVVAAEVAAFGAEAAGAVGLALRLDRPVGDAAEAFGVDACGWSGAVDQQVRLAAKREL